MSPKRYKEIRMQGNFLYQFFTESGGKIPEPIFNFTFSIWLNQASGTHPTQAKKDLLKFLDKKFDYKG